MTYTRLLKHMMEGPDVKAVKERLAALGYLHAATHDTFGDDTLAAVTAFQAANGLEADGVVSFTLYACWVPYFEFDYYHQVDGEWTLFQPQT